MASAALAFTSGLVVGCAVALTPPPTATPRPSPSAADTSTPPASTRPARTSAPTVAPVSWGLILADTQTIGSFVVFVDPASDASALVVQERGQTVGFVNLWTASAYDWTVDVSTPRGLASVAAHFVATVRADRAGIDPPGTFTSMDPTEVAVGASRGFRFGFAFEDHVGNVERVVMYVASIPGGIGFVQAHFPEADVDLPGFDDDATLVRFLPVLDQIVAGLRWPPV